MNTPAPPSSASIATIHAKLIARENQLWIGVAILLAIGIPMVFVGPLLMATIFWLATAGRSSRLDFLVRPTATMLRETNPIR